MVAGRPAHKELRVEVQIVEESPIEATHPEQALADHRVAVPVYGEAESLNLGTAATVCLYASARAQRRAE